MNFISILFFSHNSSLHTYILRLLIKSLSQMAGCCRLHATLWRSYSSDLELGMAGSGQLCLIFHPRHFVSILDSCLFDFHITFGVFLGYILSQRLLQNTNSTIKTFSHDFHNLFGGFFWLCTLSKTFPILHQTFGRFVLHFSKLGNQE